MHCSQCGQILAKNITRCQVCGAEVPAASRPPRQASEGDATGGLIPYKNMPALIAYYLAIFSLIPCAGLLLSIPALILGIIGLQRRRQNPEIRGSAHAWIGIIGGAVMTLIWSAALVLALLSPVA